jgi:hypothetical protein
MSVIYDTLSRRKRATTFEVEPEAENHNSRRTPRLAAPEASLK